MSRRSRIIYVSGAVTCLAGAVLVLVLWLRGGDAPAVAPTTATAPVQVPAPVALPEMPQEMLHLPTGRHPAGGLPGESVGTDEDQGDWQDPAEGLTDDTQPPSP